jgi:hypothetical protein
MNALIVVGSGLSFISCKTKEGCGYEDKMKPNLDKNGQLSTKKGKTKLFN